MATIEDPEMFMSSTAMTEAPFAPGGASPERAEVKRHAPGGSVDTYGRITGREQEIAVLVAEGLTNAEIARRLVLAQGSVANHIEHILRKLGMRRRTQIAVWAVKRGLH